MDVLNELIQMFENAPRLGAVKDDPEGIRYIQISETLTNSYLERLREYMREEMTTKIAKAVVDNLQADWFKIVRMSIQPEDKLIIKTNKHLPMNAIERIRAQFEELFPGHQVIVLEELDINIVQNVRREEG